MSFFDAAQAVIDDTFDEFGEPDPTTYTAPGGAAVPCTVILDTRDANARPDDGTPLVGQATIEVRKSEIAQPSVAGIFTIGARVYAVASRPDATDESGLVWRMWVE